MPKQVFSFHFFARSKFVLLLLFLSCGLGLHAQTRKINLKHADKLIGSVKSFDRLVGNVQFEHEGALMSCDSAHLYKDNSMDAYGNVHMQQGDSLNLWGDVLNYKGNERRADLSGKTIRMTDGDMTLTTDHLVYDLKSKVANYTTNGTIVNKANTLTSQIGAYSADSKTLTFSRKVKLVNPQYTMYCDTLRYLPVSKVAYFYGPTTIVATNHRNLIYCENGYYDTNNDVCAFNRKAYLITNGQRLRGDSLWYDRKHGIGKAIKNIEIKDTAKHVVIRGDVALYNEINDRSTITGHALFIQANPPSKKKDSTAVKNDSLPDKKITPRDSLAPSVTQQNDSLYLHADTLRSFAVTDSAKMKERQAAGDSLYEPERIIFAYHHAKFFRTDLQGKCDSLVYTTADSTMRLFKSPIIWSEENQLSADQIDVMTANGAIHQLELRGNSFLVSQDDSIRFNQIKGKTMTGYFKNEELERVYVQGNGQTIYCAREKNVLIGVNKADCANLMIYVKKNKVTSIVFYQKPEAQLYPPDLLPPKESKLKGFDWRDNERPETVEEIFTW